MERRYKLLENRVGFHVTFSEGKDLGWAVTRLTTLHTVATRVRNVHSSTIRELEYIFNIYLYTLMLELRSLHHYMYLYKCSCAISGSAACITKATVKVSSWKSCCCCLRLLFRYTAPPQSVVYIYSIPRLIVAWYIIKTVDRNFCDIVNTLQWRRRWSGT